MRCVMAIVLLDLLSVPAHAQQATCKLQSIEKKLTGQALSNFMEKCGDDAQKGCEQLASAPGGSIRLRVHRDDIDRRIDARPKTRQRELRRPREHQAQSRTHGAVSAAIKA